MNTNEKKATVKLLAAMAIFGTIGLFRRSIPLPSSVIAMLRGALGALMLWAVSRFRGKKPDGAAIRENLGWLLASGAAMGINWLLLFEAYNYTTVAAATVCYYLAPTFVTLLAPLVLREKLTVKGVVCAVVALGGMVLVSGAGTEGISLRGTALGVGAAVLYASVMLLNKKLHDIDDLSRTVVQLSAAAAVMVPYVLLTQSGAEMTMTATGAAALAVVCFVHTGLAYLLYFGALGSVSAVRAAIFAYLDPVVAVIVSALWLKEPMTVPMAVGAALILGSAAVGEWTPKFGKKAKA